MLRGLIVFLFSILFFACSDNSRNDYNIPISSKLDADNQLIAGISILSDAIKNNPSNPENYFKRAVLNLENENINDALIDINRAERLNPNSGEYLYLKAKILYKQKDIKALENALASENQKFDSPDLYALIAMLYNEKKNFTKAQDYMYKIERVYPYFSDLYLAKGQMYAMRGDTGTAIHNYIKATRLKPHGFEAYDNLIKIYSLNGLIDSALVINEKAIQNFPKKRELVFNKALILERAGLGDSAIKVYQRFIKIEPERYDILERIGNIYFNRKNYNSAIIVFQRWATLEPKSINPHLRIAESNNLLKNLSEAKKSIEAAIVIEPENPKLLAELQNYIYLIDEHNRSLEEVPKQLYTRIEKPKPEEIQEPERRIFGGNFGKIEKIQKRNILTVPKDTTRN